MSIVGKGLAKQNSAPRANTAKVEIRRNVLHVIGAERAHVLDAFAGDGHLYRAIWHEAASYTGCDLKFYRDERRAYVANNLRLLRAIDLSGFTLFDLDAYGCPWEQAYIIGSRRKMGKGETIGICFTEGQGLKMKMSGMSVALSIMAGLRVSSYKNPMPGLNRAQDEIIGRAIAQLAVMLGAEVTDRWEAANKMRSEMRYIGLVLRGR